MSSRRSRYRSSSNKSRRCHAPAFLPRSLVYPFMPECARFMNGIAVANDAAGVEHEQEDEDETEDEAEDEDETEVEDEAEDEAEVAIVDASSRAFNLQLVAAVVH
ncbi:hypothetical protein ACLKA6_010961 [Drosophila palustris]